MAEVINLDKRRQQKEEQEASDVLPKEVLEEMDAALVHIQTLVERIDKTLIDYSEEKDIVMDISIPLEALSRSTSFLALELDRQIPEDQIENHHKVRKQMIDLLTGTITQQVVSYNGKGTSVLSHDIYLALTNTLIEFMNRFRATQLLDRMLIEEDLENVIDQPAVENESSGGESTSD